VQNILFIGRFFLFEIQLYTNWNMEKGK